MHNNIYKYSEIPPCDSHDIRITPLFRPIFVITELFPTIQLMHSIEANVNNTKKVMFTEAKPRWT